MAGDVGRSYARDLAAFLRSAVTGAEDPRLRATWRALLPWPLLWFVAGTIGVVVAGAIVPGSAPQPATMLAFGLF